MNKSVLLDQVNKDLFGFFDKNDCWLNGTFYRYSSEIDFGELDVGPVLQIGGKQWWEYKVKNNWKTDDEYIIPTKLLTSFIHSQVLKDQLKEQKRQQKYRTQWKIVISGLVLDDWESLFLQFDLYDQNVKEIDLANNFFTETGFETLIWALNPRRSGFLIQEMEFHENRIHRTICEKWIPTFCSELPIKHVELRRGPFWFLPHFKQHCQPQTLISDKGYCCDDREDHFGIYLGMGMEMKMIDILTEDIGHDFFDRNTVNGCIIYLINLIKDAINLGLVELNGNITKMHKIGMNTPSWMSNPS